MEIKTKFFKIEKDIFAEIIKTLFFRQRKWLYFIIFPIILAISIWIIYTFRGQKQIIGWAGIVAIIAYIFYVPSNLQRQIDALADRYFMHEREYIFDNQGFEWHDVLKNSNSIKWQEIRQIEEYEKYFIFMYKRFSFFYISKDAFNTKEEYENFLEIMPKNIKQIKHFK